MAGGAFEGAFHGVAKLDLRGLKLIETLRYDGGFVRLDRHLARLEGSARRLGGPHPVDATLLHIQTNNSQQHQGMQPPHTEQGRNDAMTNP